MSELGSEVEFREPVVMLVTPLQFSIECLAREPKAEPDNDGGNSQHSAERSGGDDRRIAEVVTRQDRRYLEYRNAWSTSVSSASSEVV